VGVLLCFGAFKNHCSLFMSTYLTKTLEKELASYQIAKGTIRFTADKPLPAALVRKLVKARIAQNERLRSREADVEGQPRHRAGLPRHRPPPA